MGARFQVSDYWSHANEETLYRVTDTCHPSDRGVRVRVPIYAVRLREEAEFMARALNRAAMEEQQ